MEKHDKINGAERSALRRIQTKAAQLEQATFTIGHLCEKHRTGLEWVDVEDRPYLGLIMLQNTKLIRLVRFNDGKYYAQLTEAFDEPLADAD